MKIVLESGKSLNVARGSYVLDLWQTDENPFSVSTDRIPCSPSVHNILNKSGARSVGSLLVSPKHTVHQLGELLELSTRQLADLLGGIASLSLQILSEEKLIASKVEANVNAAAHKVVKEAAEAIRAEQKAAEDAQKAEHERRQVAARATTEVQAVREAMGILSNLPLPVTTTGRIAPSLPEWYQVRFGDSPKNQPVAQFAQRAAAVAYRDLMIQATAGKLTTTLHVEPCANPANQTGLSHEQVIELIGTLHRFESKYPQLANPRQTFIVGGVLPSYPSRFPFPRY